MREETRSLDTLIIRRDGEKTDEGTDVVLHVLQTVLLGLHCNLGHVGFAKVIVSNTATYRKCSFVDAIYIESNGQVEGDEAGVLGVWPRVWGSRGLGCGGGGRWCRCSIVIRVHDQNNVGCNNTR